MIPVEPAGCSAFFVDCVQRAATELRIQIDPASSLYVSDLLSSYATQTLTNQALCLDLMRAATETPGVKIKQFKRVGDESLMIAGAFPQQLRKKPVKISYYVRLGQIGYSNVAVLFRDRLHDEHFQHLFEDLSENFEVLRCVVEKALGSCEPTRW